MIDKELSKCNKCSEEFYHFDYHKSKDDLLCYYCLDVIGTQLGYLFIFNVEEL